MFRGDFFATVATVADPIICSDLDVISILMVAITGIIVMMPSVIVIARDSILNLCGMLMLTMLMRLARASMMQPATEYRVQQHRRDGYEVGRGVHAEFVRVR